jgi:predicted DNA-binding transcriptional regulator YafY
LANYELKGMTVTMGRKKNPDASPGEKLLALYCFLLYRRREMSLSELAEKLECSKQTISRLINQLEAATDGKVVRHSRGREAYYSLERLEKNLPQLPLDAEGLAQLALCRDFMLHLLPADMRRKINQTLDLSTAYLPPNKGGLPEIGLSLTKGAIDYTPHQDKLQALREAISAGRLCAVGYQADRNKPAKNYDLAPKKLLAYQGSLRVFAWIVDGRTPARAKYDSPALFSVQRFTMVRLLEKSSRHLPEPPIEEGVFGLMADEAFTAKVSFQSDAAAYVEERTWSADQNFEHRPDGSLVLTFQARSHLEVLSWVLSFGAQAEILAPDWLRKEMIAAVKGLAGIYKI